MSETRKIYWVGVSFDPDEVIGESDYLSQQALAIEAYLWKGETEETTSSQVGNVFSRVFAIIGEDENHAELIDIWFQDQARIGFGFIAPTGKMERTTIPVVREWMREIGISMHVDMYEFDPADAKQKKPRPAGVREMIDLG